MLYNKKTGKAYGYTQAERDKATSVSLIALASSLGYTPIRMGNTFTLKEFDSVRIYNDATWYRWSGKGNKTGGSQIDFLMEFGGASSAVDAIEMLLKFRNIDYEVTYSNVDNSVVKHNNENRTLEMPLHNDNYRRIYAYLMQTRGLSQEVVSYFIHNKLIYEDALHHNIVYCGYDPDGVIRYAGMRGTGDIYGRKFKCDCVGNDKNYGVNIVNKDSDELCVFEAVIDCMSYIDLTGDYTSNKLVLGMVEDNPLKQFLKDYSHIHKINFCLDNDEAAHKALYGNYNNLITNMTNKLKKIGYLDYSKKAECDSNYNSGIYVCRALVKDILNTKNGAIQQQEYEYLQSAMSKELIVKPFFNVDESFNEAIQVCKSMLHSFYINNNGLIKKYTDLGYSCRVSIPESGKDFNEALTNMKKDNLAATHINHRKSR